MIREFEAGRTELQPNASSFNSVLDALAKSSEDESENRAEALLRKMEDLASNNMYLSSTCRPDHVSFNIVINGWAQSRSREGAKRATSILKHMEQRYSTENTEIHPDAASYTTVINAWSRSRDNSAAKYAEEVLQWAEKAQDRGDLYVNLSTLTYNSMINCYAKSSLPGAADRALSILEMLKVRGFEQKQDQFKPDIVTYTSVIDTLAKQSTLEASEKAEALLNEVESAFEQSGDMRLKPNIRTYTSVVNAIGRSRKKPQRAESILNRVQAVCDTGNSMVKPDVVFFNALINAYGWSTEEGKSAKCYEILKVMIDLHASKENIDAKPDIVTCNSVLNACAFEKTRSEMDHEEIMNIVVETLETFQQSAPKYGYPDHATYAQVLLAISNHMPMSNKRVKLAEATFWQCCKSGNVSVMVISNLKTTLPWDRFAALLGPALKSKKGTKLRFDADKLPSSWVRHNRSALRKKTYSRPSRKRNNGYHVTKQSLSKMKSANPA